MEKMKAEKPRKSIKETEKAIKEYCDSIALPEMPDIPQGKTVYLSDEDPNANKHQAVKRSRGIRRPVNGKYIAFAACFVLALAVTAVAGIFAGINGNVNGNSDGVVKLPEDFTIPANEIVAAPVIISDGSKYTFFLPESDGSCLAVSEPCSGLRVDGKGFVTLLLSKCGIDDVSVKKYEKKTVKGEETDNGDGTITKVADITTVTINLDGRPENMPNELTFKCLVNAVLNYDSAQKVILYFGGEPVKLDGKSPKDGFGSFGLKIKEPEKIPAENPDLMVSLTVRIVDKNGMPVSGISVCLEYLSGEEGHYMPGYASTGSDGTVTRKAHPAATYRVYARLLSCMSYTPSIKSRVIFEQTKTVTLDGAAEVTFVWDESEMIRLYGPEKSLKIKVVDKKGNVLPDIFVSMYTETGGQFILGYTDKYGIATWYDNTDGKYYVTLYPISYRDGMEIIGKSVLYKITLPREGDTLTLVYDEKLGERDEATMPTVPELLPMP